MPAGLKIIQNGNITYAPDTVAMRRHWDEYNTAIRHSVHAERHYVTYLQATAEETEKYLYPKPAGKSKIVPSAPVVTDTMSVKAENEKLQKEISELKSIMIRLLDERETSSVNEDQVNSEMELMTKSKRGRPKKIE